MRARFKAWLREEHARNPWMLPGVLLSGSAALGVNLQGMIDLLGSWLA